jgi:O-acetylhomoserine/O-acetylserine sulfhydrylase-like pyridoxal-dependent enzyme
LALDYRRNSKEQKRPSGWGFTTNQKHADAKGESCPTRNEQKPRRAIIEHNVLLLTKAERPQVGLTGLVYSRFNGPNQEILEDRLGIWEGAEDRGLAIRQPLYKVTISA